MVHISPFFMPQRCSGRMRPALILGFVHTPAMAMRLFGLGFGGL